MSFLNFVEHKPTIFESLKKVSKSSNSDSDSSLSIESITPMKIKIKRTPNSEKARTQEPVFARTPESSKSRTSSTPSNEKEEIPEPELPRTPEFARKTKSPELYRSLLSSRLSSGGKKYSSSSEESDLELRTPLRFKIKNYKNSNASICESPNSSLNEDLTPPDNKNKNKNENLNLISRPKPNFAESSSPLPIEISKQSSSSKKRNNSEILKNKNCKIIKLEDDNRNVKMIIQFSNKKTNRQNDKQTERETDKNKENDIQTNRETDKNNDRENITQKKNNEKENLLQKFESYKLRIMSLGNADESSSFNDRLNALSFKLLTLERDHKNLKKSIRECSKEDWNGLKDEEIEARKKKVLELIRLEV